MPINTLAAELYKIVLRNFTKRKNILTLIDDNTREVNFIDMQLISRCNDSIRVVLYVVNIYSQHAWVIPFKDEKGEKSKTEISGCTKIWM